MEEYRAWVSLEKVQIELRAYPFSRQWRVIASSRARFSRRGMGGTLLVVNVKSMNG